MRMTRQQQKAMFAKRSYPVQFEIYLRKTKGKEPDDYGFGDNPPIVLQAKTKKEALKQLRLPKNVKIKKMEKVGW